MIRSAPLSQFRLLLPDPPMKFTRQLFSNTTSPRVKNVEGKMNDSKLQSLAIILLILGVLIAPEHVGAQITSYEMTTPAIASGPSLPVPYDGNTEKVNLSNGNLSVSIPLLTLPGRAGNNLTISIGHDSQTYHLTTAAFYMGQQQPQTPMAYGVSYQPADSFPAMPGNHFWRLQLPTLIAYREQEGIYPYCTGPESCGPDIPLYCDHFAYLDWDGVRHDFGNAELCYWAGPGTYPGSGPTAPTGVPLPIHVNYVTGTTFGTPGRQSFSGFMKLDTTNTSDVVVTERNGTQVHFNLNLNIVGGVNPMSESTGQFLGPMPVAFTKIVDRSGNTTTLTVASSTYVLTDTLGRQVTIDSTGVTYPDDTIPAPSTRHIAFGPGPTPAPSSLSLTVSGCALNYEYDTNSTMGSSTTSVGGTSGTTTAITFPNNEVTTLGNDALGELSFIQYGDGGYKRFVYGTWTIAGYGTPYGDGSIPPVACSSANARQVTAKFECPTGTCGCTQSSSASACAGESQTLYTPSPINPIPASEQFGGNQQNVVQYYDLNQSPLKKEVHSFAFGCWYVPLETTSQLYDAQDNPVRTTTTEYSNTCLSPTSITTTYNDMSPAKSSTVSYGYPAITLLWDGVSNQTVTFDKPTSTTYTDFTGSVLRSESTPLLWQSNSGYGVGGAYLLDLISSTSVSGGGASAYTTYGYDEYSLQPSNVSVQHTAGASPQGNLTSIHRLLNGLATKTTNCPITINNGYAVNYRMYFDTGSLYQATDSCGKQAGDSSHTVTYSYSSNYAGAYLTTITNPAGQSFSYAYDLSSGALTSEADPNSQQTRATYVLGRLTQVNYPDGGQTSYCYTDVGGATCSESLAPLQIVSTKMITSSLNKTSSTVLDGFGRPSQTQLSSDTPSATYTLIQYDTLGRKSQVYNPTRCTGITTNCGESTWGYTKYQYDPLDRVTSVTEQDGSTLQTTYDQTCTVYTSAVGTLVTDEAGNQRRSCTDSLGRLLEVDEPGGTGTLSMSTPFVTLYQYDGLGNLICVVQKGTDATQFTSCASAPATWRPRSFTYDSLSRLLTASNPESGTISYAYDANGNLVSKTAPLPNQVQNGTSTVTTTYTYDALNRLTGKTYMDNGTIADPYTTPVVYGYDGVTPQGCAPPVLADSYPIGRRTSMCDGSGATSWDHDQMGRVKQDDRFIGGVRPGKFVNYGYNLDGSLAYVTTPPLKTVAYTYNGAGQAVQAVDTTDGINFVTNATYAPPGELINALVGSAIHGAGSYNARLQPLQIYYGTNTPPGLNGSTCPTTVGNIMHRLYNFSFGSGDNGNAMTIANCRDTTRTQLFTYDALNRTTSGKSGGVYWGETFTIDAWGNLTSRALISGKNNYEPLSVSATSQNQLTGFGYDPAGNMTSNTAIGATYTYDAENRLIWMNGINGGYLYVYDGDGKRVEKCAAGSATTPCPTSGTGGTLYWRGIGADTLDESDLSGNPEEEYVFFNGQRFARRDVTSTGATIAVHYYFSDHLGSHSVITNAAGTQCEQDIDYYPYGGGEHDYCATPVAQNYKFTGKERDAESGLDNFGARYDASSMGRFMSADPVFISADRLTDPQSLNLYAYVRNNPLSLVDPTGLDFYLACQTSDHSGCGQVTNGDGGGKSWVQGQTVNGQFQATDVDMNDSKDASAGYHDQFGNQYTGSFDQNNGVSFTNTATGDTSGHSRFIDGSDETDVNGATSGAFNGIQGRFFDACGGSCEGRASLYETTPGAFASAEAALHKQGGFMNAIDLLSGAHKSGAQWKDSSGYVHMLNPSGQMEMHFEGHPTGVDVQQFVLHMVDTIRDATSGRAAAEKNAPLP